MYSKIVTCWAEAPNHIFDGLNLDGPHHCALKWTQISGEQAILVNMHIDFKETCVFERSL